MKKEKADVKQEKRIRKVKYDRVGREDQIKKGEEG